MMDGPHIFGFSLAALCINLTSALASARLIGSGSAPRNAVSLVVETGRDFSGCATRVYGFSQWPESAERKIASITAILLIPSETETGTSPPSRMAREKAWP